MIGRGDRFVESLNDGRSVWLEGGRVDNLEGHSAFRGTLSTIKRLFDMLDEPGLRERIGFVPEGGDRYAHGSFLVPYEAADLAKRSESFAHWAKETHGMMTRLSDYGRSMITGWYAARRQLGRLDPHFETKIERYYEEARDRDLFLTTAILDPQIDRSEGLDDSRIAESMSYVRRPTASSCGERK